MSPYLQLVAACDVKPCNLLVPLNDLSSACNLQVKILDEELLAELHQAQQQSNFTLFGYCYQLDALGISLLLPVLSVAVFYLLTVTASVLDTKECVPSVSKAIFQSRCDPENLHSLFSLWQNSWDKHQASTSIRSCMTINALFKSSELPRN